MDFGVRVSRVVCALALLLIGGFVSPVAAQDAAPQSNQLLLPNLHGLRLVSKPSEIQKSGYDRRGVTIDGPYILYRPGIYEKLQGFIGKPLYTADLQRITAVIAEWYKSKNRPFVDVAFPEQDISTGVLQAVVTEFKVGKVIVKGNRWFSSGLLRSQIDLSTGDPIDVVKLNRDIGRINQNDFLNVSVVTQKSDTPGDTDIVLQTEDDFPLRFNTSYTNNGVPITGRDRWNIGFTWGDALWLGEQFSYQYTSNVDFWLHPKRVPVEEGKADFGAHSANYMIPFSWGDSLVLTGAYSQVRPQIGPDFGEVGVSWQAGLRYVVPLAFHGWDTSELQFGADFKRTNSNLQFGGVDISNVTTDIAQFIISYSGAVSDAWGQTRLANRIALSPGHLTGGNTDEAFQPSTTHTGTPYAKARYAYDDASVVRLTPLPWGMGLVTRLEAQWSSAVLAPSERLEAGGIETVRGYDEYAASGTEGVLFTQEIRSPQIQPLHDLISDSINDQLQLDAFFDFAYLRDQKVTTGTKHGVTIDSVGAGFQYQISTYFSARFDYGWQLQSAPGATKRGSQIDVSITLNN